MSATTLAVIDAGRASGMNFVRLLHSSKGQYRIVALERSVDS